MLAQGRLGDAEHAPNVRFGNAVGGHGPGSPPLRVSGGQNRSSHWKFDGKGLACPLRGDVLEGSTVAVEHRLLAGKLLPALHRNAGAISIAWHTQPVISAPIIVVPEPLNGS